MSGTTSTHELLHRLVDALPDDDAATAARVLEALAWRADPAAAAAALAPVDDEPEGEAERVAVAEARADVAAGRVVSAAEVRALLATDAAER